MSSSRRMKNLFQFTPNTTPSSSSAAISPLPLKNVCLYDWWLIKVDAGSSGWKLGVGGYPHLERPGIRAFLTGAIVRRHESITLETVDEVTITLGGLINSSRTQQNGFSFKDCNHFRWGFPDNWEKCTDLQSDGQNSSDDEMKSSLPSSFDDVPVSRVRDILISTAGDPESCVARSILLNDLLRKCNDILTNAGPSVSAEEKLDSQRMTTDSELTECWGEEKSTIQREPEIIIPVQDGTKEKTEDEKSHNMSHAGVDVHNTREALPTRMSTRSQSLKNKQVQDSPSESSSRSSLRRNATKCSMLSDECTKPRGDAGTKKNHCLSVRRRSGRLKMKG